MTLFKLGKYSFQVYGNSATWKPNYPTRYCMVLGFDWFSDISGFIRIGGFCSGRGLGYFWKALRFWRIGMILLYESTSK